MTDVTRVVAALLLLVAAPGFAQSDTPFDSGVSLDAGTLVPPALLTASPAAYPSALEAQGIEGEVSLRLLVSDVGTVVETTVVSATAPEFEAAAREAATHLVFRPALLDGKPTAVLLEYVYRFSAPGVDAGPTVPQAVLSGKVKTKGTPRGIAAAFVTVGDAGAVETDGDGAFSLSVPPGNYAVTVAASGHLTETFEESLAPAQHVNVVYRLQQPFSTPYETVVRGQKDRAEVSRVQLSGPELLEVAGTRGEPLRVIMLLPGVASVGSGLSYPVVRGSVPAATGFYIDGVRVPQLFHLLAGPQVVHPEFIESIDFYPANAPVRFGNITGGVVSAATKSPSKELHLEGSVDFINAGAYAEVPIEKTGTNVTLAGRVSYTGWLLGLLAGALDPTGNTKPVVDFYDYQARVDQKVGAGSLRLFVFGSSDLVGSHSTEPGATSPYLTSLFHRADLRYRVPVGPGTFETGVTLGWESLGIYSEVDEKRDGAFLLNRFLLSGRAQYTLPLLETLQLRFAGDIERQVSGVEYSFPMVEDDPLKLPAVMGVFSGLSAELGWTPGTLSLVAGVRAASFHAQPGIQRWALEPRLNVRWGLPDEWTLKGGVGLFHQPPTLLINLPISDVAGLRDGLQETMQTSLGVEKKLPFGIEASAEVFFNPMFTVLEKSLRQFLTGTATYGDLNPPAYGQAYGLELLVRSPAKGRFFGWVSYSLMRSERLRTFPVFGSEFDDVTIRQGWVPFAFDQTHTLNVVAGYQLAQGLKASLTVHFNSGHPETGEVSSRSQTVVTRNGQESWFPVPLDQVGRLPSFFRVDARIAKTWTLDELSIEFFVDVFNTSFSQEVLLYNYGTTRLPNGTVRVNKSGFSIPVVLPTIGLKGSY